MGAPRSTAPRAPRAHAPRRAAHRRSSREPGGRDLPLEPGGDLGGRALRLARLRAEPAPERGPLGRPVPDPRPRLGDRRLGALGQRLVPAHRRARLRRCPRRGGGVLPALPAHARRRSGGCSAATTSLAGIVVSLAASLGAFVLLYRLAEARLGADGARRAVLYLAVFPMALFLGAVYSRVAVPRCSRSAAFLLAERRRWLGAGRAHRARDAHADRRRRAPAGARASWPGARRSGGGRSLALVRRAADLRRLSALPRASPAATRSRFARSQGFWNRHLSYAGPLGGIWDGLRVGVGRRRAARVRLAHARRTGRRCRTPTRCARPRSTSSAFAFLVLFVALTVDRLAPVRCRRTGSSAPSASRSRSARRAAAGRCCRCRASGSSLFPFFLALAVIGGRPRVHTAILVVERDHARRGRLPVGALAMGRVALVAAAALLAPRREPPAASAAEPTGAPTRALPRHGGVSGGGAARRHEGPRSGSRCSPGVGAIVRVPRRRRPDRRLPLAPERDRRSAPEAAPPRPDRRLPTTDERICRRPPRGHARPVYRRPATRSARSSGRSPSSACSPATGAGRARWSARSSGARDASTPRLAHDRRRQRLRRHRASSPTVLRPVADRRPAPRGPRPNVAGDSPRPGRSTWPSLPASNPTSTSPRRTARRRSPTCARTRRRGSSRAVRDGRFASLDAGLLAPGPAIGDGLAPVARAPPPGCVSLTSTPSPSTATGRCVRCSTPCRGCALRSPSVGWSATTEIAGARSRPRSRYYRPRAHRGPRRREPGGAATRLRATSSSTRPARTSSRTRSWTHSWARSVFEPCPARSRRSRKLRARGLRLAVVSNWDVGARRAPRAARRSTALFDTDRDLGARPAPPSPIRPIFRLALERLGVDPARALHVGDEPRTRKAPAPPGMRFACRPRSPTAFDGLGVTALAAEARRLGRSSSRRSRCSATRAGRPAGSRRRTPPTTTRPPRRALVQYAIILGIVLLIARPRLARLLALRRPRSWARALAPRS